MTLIKSVIMSTHTPANQINTSVVHSDAHDMQKSITAIGVTLESSSINLQNQIMIESSKIDLDIPICPVSSSFIVLDNRTYSLCDTLEVHIKARSKNNKTKSFGGDYFWAWIRNAELRASAAADVIIDRLIDSSPGTSLLLPRAT